MNFRFPQFSPMPLDSIVTNSSADGIVLLEDMLRWNPSKRPTAVQSLKYNYFKSVQKTGQQNSSVFATSDSHKNLNKFFDKSDTEVKPNGNLVNYDLNESPNLDNNSIKQLQQQIGSQSSKNSSNSAMRSGMSIKEQYLARSRYIAGQNTKNAAYRSSAVYGNGMIGSGSRRQSIISIHSTQNRPMIAANVTGKTDWAANSKTNRRIRIEAINTELMASQ